MTSRPSPVKLLSKSSSKDEFSLGLVAFVYPLWMGEILPSHGMPPFKVHESLIGKSE